jgi:hypothetical protein
MHIYININKKSYIVKKMFRKAKWILLQNSMGYNKTNLSG